MYWFLYSQTWKYPCYSRNLLSTVLALEFINFYTGFSTTIRTVVWEQICELSCWLLWHFLFDLLVELPDELRGCLFHTKCVDRCHENLGGGGLGGSGVCVCAADRHSLCLQVCVSEGHPSISVCVCACLPSFVHVPLGSSCSSVCFQPQAEGLYRL